MLTLLGLFHHAAMQYVLCPACRAQAFLAELNKRDPAAVLRLVDSKTLAVNSAVIVEYLKALVKTDKISQFSSDGAVGYVPRCSMTCTEAV